MPDSVYHQVAGVEVYDEERDARTFPGGMPVVAHPPCGPWGRLRHFCKAGPEVAELAPWAVEVVRREGGVLEHPSGSKLWGHCRLPRPGEDADGWGGYTVAVDQLWWGHSCNKATWLYIVGCGNLPRLPLALPPAPTRVVKPCRKSHRDERLTICTKRERSATPPLFAEWLVETARRSVVARGEEVPT